MKKFFELPKFNKFVRPSFHIDIYKGIISIRLFSHRDNIIYLYVDMYNEQFLYINSGNEHIGLIL